MNKLRFLLMACCCVMLAACSDDEPSCSCNNDLFVVNEGGYGASSASLSVINTDESTVDNSVFKTANGFGLGDIASSMSINGNTGWICVNNSNKVYAINVDSYEMLGSVEITQPRYAQVLKKDKMYVTQMYTNTITIVNPKTFEITGTIEVPQANVDLNGGSTEQIIKVGNYAYVNCWSYQREVVKIDINSDKVVASLDMGVQPKAMAYDGKNTLWVLIDGGSWDQNPAGYEAPSIAAIDLKSFTVTRTVTLNLGGYVSSLCYHDGYLYWLDNGVYRMKVTDTEMPAARFITTSTPWSLYALTVDPDNGDIFVSDAMDYTNAGMVYQYTNAGEPKASYNVGVCPGSFCWNR